MERIKECLQRSSGTSGHSPKMLDVPSIGQWNGPRDIWENWNLVEGVIKGDGERQKAKWKKGDGILVECKDLWENGIGRDLVGWLFHLPDWNIDILTQTTADLMAFNSLFYGH